MLDNFRMNEILLKDKISCEKRKCTHEETNIKENVKLSKIKDCLTKEKSKKQSQDRNSIKYKSSTTIHRRGWREFYCHNSREQRTFSRKP